ncbi:MAG: MerR family DNA-binding protein [Solirubrobacteraceae bacterium]
MFVLAVKRLGLPLPRIRELLPVWEAQPCRTVQGRLRDLVDEQLKETRRRMTELRALEQQLLDGRARLDELPARNRACDPTCPFQQHPAG